MSSRLNVDLPAEPPSFGARVLLILWPAFVMAGVLEMAVFAVLDPDSLTWFGAEPIDWSRSTVYSITFLIFWGAIATSGAITKLLEAQQADLDGEAGR